MGLVNLPVLNRTGSSICWNVNLISKYLENNFFIFFFILKKFFNIFFLDFLFFFKKSKEKLNFQNFVKNNILTGKLFLLKINNWYVCYLNYFYLFEKTFKKPKKF